MRRLNFGVALMVAVALAVVVSAEVLAVGAPGQIAYQGFLTQGNSPVEGTHDLEFTVYADSTGGSPLPWQEGHQAVQFSDGIFKVLLGRHQPFPADLFASPNRFLETKVDGQALTPRTRLAAVPYAFVAVKADTAAFAQTGGTGESVWQVNGQNISYTGGNVGIETTTPSARLTVAGSPGGNAVRSTELQTTYGTVDLVQESPTLGRVKADFANHSGGGDTGFSAAIEFERDPVANAGNIHLSTGSNALSRRLTVAADGRIGVGTQTPQSEFEVRGENARLRVAHWDGYPNLDLVQETGTHSSIKADFRSMSGGGNTGVLAAVEFERSPTANAGAIHLSTGENNSFARRVTVDSQGNLGIGTTTPTVKLHVAGDLCITGAKNAIVQTSEGMRKLYCDESTSPFFSTRGWGRLIAGRAHVDLDPLYLETVSVDAEHPLMVDATFYGPHGNWYVEAGRTGFNVIDPNGSEARFHWMVQAARRGYENVYLERAEVAHAAARGGRNQ